MRLRVIISIHFASGLRRSYLAPRPSDMSHADPSPTYPGTPSFSAPAKTFIPLLTSEGRVTGFKQVKSVSERELFWTKERVRLYQEACKRMGKEDDGL